MRRVIAGALLLSAVAAQAQEGFPLDGTWRGERQASGTAATAVVLIIQWEGQQLTGLLNPGPKAAKVQEASLNPAGWRVHISASSASGTPIVIDGRLSELGSYRRVLTGTWTEAGQHYPVRFTRE